jgi:DNA-binding transcriptional LysR family regulator
MPDLNGMEMFVAVADAKGFRAAGERLGVSGAAVSQALRRLEQRLGIALVQRTTRSVHLTEAGERLYAAARPALNDLEVAVAAVGEMGVEPRGTLRVHITRGAETYFTGPLLGGFLTANPHVRLDLAVSDALVDIVAGGYDAGVRLGEVVDRDMIAVPVSGDIRLVVVGAPSYFAQHPKPRHPRELSQHECINWHAAADARPYRWEFTEQGRNFSIDVMARVLTTDPVINIRLACEGTGLTMAREDRMRDEIARGALVRVLDEFSPPFPGYYLYYPQRRHASPALRALVDYVRGTKRNRLEAPKRQRRGAGSRKGASPDRTRASHASG